MATYIIDYDLNTPGKNYDALISQIKTYPWAKICKSSWAVKSSQTAAQIRDSLTPHIDSDDKLFVAKIDGWAAWGLPKEVTDWLKK